MDDIPNNRLNIKRAIEPNHTAPRVPVKWRSSFTLSLWQTPRLKWPGRGNADSILHFQVSLLLNEPAGRHRKKLLAGLSLVYKPMLSWLSHAAQDYQSRHGATHCGLGPPTSVITIKTIPNRHVHRWIWSKVPGDSGLCQVDSKN